MDDAPISDDPGNETGREEMLLALREHDLRERVFEGYPDAIVLVDANGTITDMNRRAAQLLGRTVDERIDYDQVVVGEDGHGNPTTQDGPVTVRRADGSTASAEARMQTLEGTDGPITAVVLVEPAAGNTEASPSERDRRPLADPGLAASQREERQRDLIARLQAIIDAALVHASLDDVFDTLLGRLLEVLDADAATVLLLAPEEQVLRVRAHSGLERPPELRPDVPVGSGVAGRIAERRHGVIVHDLRRARPVSPFLQETLRSLAGVPILYDDRVTGVLHVDSVRDRRFTDDDLALLEIVAARLAPAIENAQLHERERAAAALAQRDAAHLRLVQDVAEAVGTIRPVDEMARIVLDKVLAVLGASGAGVALLSEDGTVLELVALAGYEAEVFERYATIPLDADLPIVDSVARGSTVLLGSPQERRRSYPGLDGDAPVGRAWASLPLQVDGSTIGALTISFPQERRFDASDTELLGAIARQCAQAIDRARRYELERRIARQAEATANRLSLLQSLTARFSRALTPREVASVTVSEASSGLGAISGAFMVLDEEGMLRIEASDGYRDDSIASWERFPADLPTPAGDALRTVDVIVAASSEELLERYPILSKSLTGRTTGPTATVPIVVDQRAIGAASFTFEMGRVIDDEERLLMLALGRHAGQALERARLYETEQLARREAERARERTERLQGLAEDLVDADTPDEVGAVLSQHMLAALGASATAVFRLQGDRVAILASRGYLPEVVERYHDLDLDANLPICEAIRTRLGVWTSTREEARTRFPEFVGGRGQPGTDGAFAAIPLKVAERILGSVGVEFAEERDWTDDDKEYLRSIARQSAQAMEQVELRGVGARTRTELERSERRYRSLVESTSAVTWTVDPAGAFVEPQPSWESFTGQLWERHRGFGWVDAIEPSERERVLDAWFAARDAGTLYHVETRLWHEPAQAYHHIVARAAPVRDEDDRVVEWVGIVLDVDTTRREELARAGREEAARAETELASDRLAYLAAASTILATTLDVGETLQRLVDLAVPRLADWCAIDMLAEDGSIQLVAVAHVDPRKVELARDVRRRYPPDPEDPSGMPYVLRSGESFLMEEIPEELLEQAKEQNPELAELVDELQLRSAMVVPITAGEHVLGAMTFVWAESGNTYGRADLALAEDLGHRAGVAIENARLYEAERSARAEEALARERLQVIAEAGAEMAGSLDERRLVQALTRTIARRVADASIVYLLDSSRRVEEVIVAHRDPGLEAMLRRAAMQDQGTAEERGTALGRVLSGEDRVLVREGEDVPLDVPRAQDDRSAFRPFVPASEIAVALTARGKTLGVLAMVRSEGERPFDDDDLQLATDLGRRAALLLDNARLYSVADEVSETLQRSLLPPELPTIPGLDIGARWLPAAQGLSVSGDFYDVFELDLDHWGAVIGDVVGKGAQAAAMMGLARYTLRTAALTESRPSALLRTLNDAIIRQTRESMFCTACFARVHRRETDVRVTLASGGHPLPIVIRADGTVGEVGAPGTLLGIFDDPTLNDRALDLHPGDAIVLYTDGVTDERRDDEEFGETRLLETLRSLAGGDAKAIADGVVHAVEDFRTGLAHDDIAILVIRVRPDPGGSR